MTPFDSMRAQRLQSLVCRRDLLKIGPLAISASILPSLMTGSVHAEIAVAPTAKAKSIIFLWMAGGVTHIDSLDPKPEAPEQIRGTLNAIPTAMPGVFFSEACPNLARVAKDLAVVRSFSHDSDDHLLSQVYTLSGRKVTQAQLFTEPNIGSMVQYLLGSRNGMPGYIAVPGITRPGPPPHNLFVGGWLGNQYAPFCIGGQPEQPDFTVGEKEEDPSPRASEDLNPPELRFPQEVTIGASSATPAAWKASRSSGSDFSVPSGRTRSGVTVPPGPGALPSTLISCRNFESSPSFLSAPLSGIGMTILASS